MTIILSLVFGFILFICGSVIALLFVILYYLRSFSGVILFRIDNINKRVLRLSDKYLFMSTIFDSKKNKFNTYKYITIESFLNFLNEKTSKKLQKYLNSETQFQSDLVISFDQINTSSSELNLTIFEKLILKLEKILNYKTTYVLKIISKNDGHFRCSISWHRNRVYAHENVNSLIKHQKKLNTFFQKKVVLAFALKPYFYINEIQPLEIISIYKHFGIPYKKSYIDIRDGFLYFVFAKRGQSSYLELVENVKQLNKNFLLTKYFIAGTIFTEENSSKIQNDSIQLLDKIRYCLFNILNNREHSDEYINVHSSIVLEDKYKEFVYHYNEYIKLNTNENFDLKSFKIKVYKSHNDSILSVREIVPKNFNVQYLEFFKKVPYLNYLFESSWYENIKNTLNENLHAKKAIGSNMVKVSQEVFLKSEITDSTISPTYLVYAYKNLFDYEKLRTKIETNYGYNMPTALYVDKIDKPLINVINYTKLKVIVIGEVISKRLNETRVFYDCINIVNLAKKNDIRIVYENPNLNLDPLIVEKAQIKAYFQK